MKGGLAVRCEGVTLDLSTSEAHPSSPAEGSMRVSYGRPHQPETASVSECSDPSVDGWYPQFF